MSAHVLLVGLLGAPSIACAPQELAWPRIERLELEADVRTPGRFEARAILELAQCGARVPVLLNSGLEVHAARVAAGSTVGREVRVSRGPSLRSQYHREARVLWLDLGEEPAGGTVALELEYGGAAEDGSGTRDWRGMLLVSPTEARMSVQTVFYPQVPLNLAGPAVQGVRGKVQLLLPERFEAFVPGEPCEPGPVPEGGGRRVCFEIETPRALSIVAAPRTRSEKSVGDMQFVALLAPERAELARELLDEASRVLAWFAERFGPADTGFLGVCEIACLGENSYNWAADGVMVFDGAALSNGVPRAKVAHEAAHLWFGQGVGAAGAGERFLTESLAEFAAWRYLEAVEGEQTLRELVAEARAEWLAGVHAAAADPALESVVFATPGYQALAYAKGPLVLRVLEQGIGREAFDCGLARYVERFSGKSATLADFVECLGVGAERVRELAPWIFEAGHAHLELVIVNAEPDRLAARVVPEACPDGIASLARGAVTVEAITAGGRVTTSADPATGGAFELALPGAARAVVLDPDGRAVAAVGPPTVLDGARLVASAPPDGAQDVDYLVREIVLTFDRPLAVPDEVDTKTIRDSIALAGQARELGYPWIGAIELRAGGRELVLPLREPLLPGRECLLHIAAGLASDDGVPVAAIELTFRTRPSDDAEVPRVASSEPARDAAEVDPATKELRIVFSEPMRPSIGFKTVEVRRLEGRGWTFPPLGRSSRWEEGGTVLVWALDEPLRPATRYALPFGANYRDLAGNVLESLDLCFTTRR